MPAASGLRGWSIPSAGRRDARRSRASHNLTHPMNWIGKISSVSLSIIIVVTFAIGGSAQSMQAKARPHSAARHTDSPPQISGARAMEYVRQVVAIGPRPVGSPAHKKLEEYIRVHLRSDNLEEDTF